MLNKLTLNYFRQHVEKTVLFHAGINAIRGDNEAGKTTILEAFAYLCYGSRALRQPLDEVVTYHQPVSKLRVDGVITHLGVVYTAYRAKSGAEVTFGNERITGQTEVTKFFERLFGADAELAGKLMVANQKSLGESLAAGPTAAGKLIEELANFSVIEDLVELMQTKTPTGLTAGVEARLAQLRGQLTDEVVEDLSPLEDQVSAAAASLAEARQEHVNLALDRDDLDVDLAKSILADEARLQSVISSTTAELASVKSALAVEPPIDPTDAEISRARKDVEDQKDLSRATGIHAKLVAAKVEELWDEPFDALEKAIKDQRAKISDQAEVCRELRSGLENTQAALADGQFKLSVEITKLEGRLIKETTCAFCDKDLTDVPEVVTRNSELQADIERRKKDKLTLEQTLGQGLAAQRAEHEAAMALGRELEEYLSALEAVVYRNNVVERLYAEAGDLITVDRSIVPGAWAWAGPDVTGDRQDAAPILKDLERRRATSIADTAARAEKTAQCGSLQARIDAAVLEKAGLMIDEAKDTITKAAALGQKITAAEAKVASAAATHGELAGQLATKLALRGQAAAQREKLIAQVGAAEAELSDMQRNNALVKKIKAARPVITDKLWSLVLAGASKYFSEVRGESSSITRDDSTFKCNGQPVAGLSGSAQDMLGLAVRITLTKTFLPGSDFLILDEPGAACSDLRETLMLGMLSTLGFGQIIMVSHSTLVDAFSDHVITI